MPTTYEVRLVLEAEGNMEAALKSATGAVHKLDQATPGAEKAVGGLSGAMGTLGKVGLSVFGAGQVFGLVTSALSGFVGDAIDAEKTTAQLNAVLASTKGVSGVTAEAVNALSTSLSKVAPFEDEAITGAQSLLLTFTKIGADVFPAATETVLNMSQALGQDLSSSSVQLGKALNDPIKGITALSRVGVSFTQEQKDTIKSMVEMGDVAGAQAVILAELEVEFGGAAKAAGTTFAGSLTIAQTAAGNVKEAIAGPLIGAVKDLLIQVTPMINAFAEWLPAALATAQPVLEFMAKHLVDFLIPALVLMGVTATVAAASTVIALLPVIAPIVAIGAAVMLLREIWERDLGGIQEKTKAVWDFLNEYVFPPLTAAFVFLKDTLLPAVGQVWGEQWKAMQAALTVVWGVIQTTVETVWPIVEQIILAGTALVKGDWLASWEAISGAFKLAWEAVQRLLGELVMAVLNALVQLAKDAADAAKRVGEGIVGGIVDTIKDLGGAIKDALMGAVQGALNAAGDAIKNWKAPSIPMPSIPTFGRGAGAPPEIVGGDLAAMAGPKAQVAMQKALALVGGGRDYIGWCERFVENMFGTSGRFATAWTAANAITSSHSLAAPAGTMVFFRPDPSNVMAGHVGISLGDGRFVSATNNGVTVDRLDNAYWKNLYHGYGVSPFAKGGWITEPIFGVGQKSGRGYTLGEHEPELVVPRSKVGAVAGGGGGGAPEIHVHLHGNYYGQPSFADAVLAALEEGRRRGRV
jgi:hypothetical protein